LALAGLPAYGAESRDDEIRALREQIQLLDQKLRVLERKQEIKEEDAAVAAKAAPKVTVTDRGFTLASGDSANSIRFRGLVQLDSRVFFNDGGIVNNSFILRRARPILEGTFAKNYSFQFVPEFGGSTVSILDANLGISINKALQFKLGKFKAPIGLELLQSDSTLYFAERSLVTNLVPNRDLGIQVSGDLFKGTINYTAGIFNGLPDGGSTTNADIDNDKDFIARVMATPFKNSLESPFQGLAFGVSASLGREKSTSGRTSAYRTDGQQTFFSYLANTTSDGQSWRLSPQLDYRHGPLGVTAEYVLSVVNVRPSATGAKAELQNKAWQVSTGYVLTGEDSSYTGVVPKTNFSLDDGTWGAVELVGRYSQLHIDDNAFPLFASPTASADRAESFAVGVNWYLSKSVRIMFDYFQTQFDFNAAAPAVSSTAALRQDEKALFTRFQLTF
jgi:phosphate-selective porin OprO/OprP